jgi:hypothetical protein
MHSAIGSNLGGDGEDGQKAQEVIKKVGARKIQLVMEIKKIETKEINMETSS